MVPRNSVAAQVVQAYAPVGTAEVGDGRSAVMALEAKYRLDGESRIQELVDQLANLRVTESGQYDPARVIQELRRFCVNAHLPHLLSSYVGPVGSQSGSSASLRREQSKRLPKPPITGDEDNRLGSQSRGTMHLCEQTVALAFNPFRTAAPFWG